MAAPKLFSGFSNVLNVILTTGGSTPGPPANGPYPGVYCSVFDLGTQNLAAILGQNPFLVNSDGSFAFYGTAAQYSILFSTTPSAVVSGGGGGASVPTSVNAVNFLMAAPNAPKDGDMWPEASGTAPRTIYLKLRDQGVTKTILTFTS